MVRSRDFMTFKMAARNVVVSFAAVFFFHYVTSQKAAAKETKSVLNETILEDKLVDLWPDYSCLYDVSSQNFKNRNMRDTAMAEIAEKLGENGAYSGI